ncbi:MAG: response regulator [Lachnospiraceae bacterium]|nr:response regulator [Lachnospiraceae bacterium]
MYKVFLVDDDSFILEELVEMVQWAENGFEVSGSCTDPQEALRRIPELRPEVVFCDLKMPVMDGNELIRRLREAGVDCEFVMLSAYDSFENVRTFFQQTGFDYILKPVNNEDIQIVLERLMAKLAEKYPLEDREGLTENPEFNKLVTYLNENFEEKITLGGLAQQFGFSKNYICALFQKYYNKSLNLYLTDLRMAHARELLMDKTILIKEVAYHCGYMDYYHFFKVFKEHYGISPREMREQNT